MEKSNDITNSILKKIDEVYNIKKLESILSILYGKYDYSCALSHLNDYEFIGELGRGFVGVVYEVLKNKNNYVLKIIDPVNYIRSSNQIASMVDGSLGKIAGDIGIGPKVYDYGKCKNINGYDIEWVLMEKIDGIPLGKLPLKEAIGYIPMIAEKYYNLLINGVIQRDLNPTNIMISNGIVYIIDYGNGAKYDIKKAKEEYRPNYYGDYYRDYFKMPLELLQGSLGMLIYDLTIANDIWLNYNAKTRSKLFMEAYDAAISWMDTKSYDDTTHERHEWTLKLPYLRSINAKYNHIYAYLTDDESRDSSWIKNRKQERSYLFKYIDKKTQKWISSRNKIAKKYEEDTNYI